MTAGKWRAPSLLALVLPEPVWCRCHCAAPKRVLRSTCTAEMSQPEAVRKAGLDWTSGPCGAPIIGHGFWENIAQ